MSTAITRTPRQKDRETLAIHHNMQRDDWMPHLLIRGPISRTVHNVVYPDGTRPVLMKHSARKWVVSHHEHLGRFPVPTDAARAAKAEALRQWKEQDQ